MGSGISTNGTSRSQYNTNTRLIVSAQCSLGLPTRAVKPSNRANRRELKRSCSETRTVYRSRTMCPPHVLFPQYGCSPGHLAQNLITQNESMLRGEGEERDLQAPASCTPPDDLSRLDESRHQHGQEQWKYNPTDGSMGHKPVWVYGALNLQTDASDAYRRGVQILCAQLRHHGIYPLSEDVPGSGPFDELRRGVMHGGPSRLDVRNMIRSSTRCCVAFDIIATQRLIRTGEPHRLATELYTYLDEQFPICVKFSFIGISDSLSRRVARDIFCRERLSKKHPRKKLSYDSIDGTHLYLADRELAGAERLRQRGIQFDAQRAEEERRRRVTERYTPPPQPKWLQRLIEQCRCSTQSSLDLDTHSSGSITWAQVVACGKLMHSPAARSENRTNTSSTSQSSGTFQNEGLSKHIRNQSPDLRVDVCPRCWEFSNVSNLPRDGKVQELASHKTISSSQHCQVEKKHNACKRIEKSKDEKVTRRRLFTPDVSANPNQTKENTTEEHHRDRSPSTEVRSAAELLRGELHSFRRETTTTNLRVQKRTPISDSQTIHEPSPISRTSREDSPIRWAQMSDLSSPPSSAQEVDNDKNDITSKSQEEGSRKGSWEHLRILTPRWQPMPEKLHLEGNLSQHFSHGASLPPLCTVSPFLSPDAKKLLTLAATVVSDEKRLACKKKKEDEHVLLRNRALIEVVGRIRKRNKATVG